MAGSVRKTFTSAGPPSTADEEWNFIRTKLNNNNLIEIETSIKI